MLTPYAEPVKVKLGGKEYQLLYDYNSIAEAEQILNKTLLMEVIYDVQQKPKIDFVRDMFFALARPRHPELTTEQVKGLIHSVSTMTKAWLASMKALTEGAAERDEEPEPSDPQQDQS